jgi:MFS family permease
VTAYAPSFGSLLLVGGRLGDVFSRKWVFVAGLVGFAVASAIGGAAGQLSVRVVDQLGNGSCPWEADTGFQAAEAGV